MHNLISNKMSGFMIALWAVVILLYSCHPAPAQSSSADKAEGQINSNDQPPLTFYMAKKFIRCMSKLDILQLMADGKTYPLLSGTASIVNSQGNIQQMPMVLFADSESGKWALVEFGNGTDGCIIDMGTELDLSPKREHVEDLMKDKRIPQLENNKLKS